MENDENRDGDDVVASSRDIRNDGGNVQAPPEIMTIANYSGENLEATTSNEEMVSGFSAGSPGQRNGDDGAFARDERRSRRTRSLSEADAVRPPPLNLSSIGVNVPSIDEERESVGGSSSTNLPEQGEDSFSRGAHVDVNVFRYQPGVMGPPENLKNYKINARGAALLGGMLEDVQCQSNSFARTGTMDIASEYEKLKGMNVMRYHIKDHRAKQLLVVPSDDKFVALAAPEAFSRHSGTCMIIGGQGSYTSRAARSYKLMLGHFLRIGSVGVVVSEIHTGVPGGSKCLSWEELTRLKGDIAAIQKDLASKEALTARQEGSLALRRQRKGKKSLLCENGTNDVKDEDSESEEEEEDDDNSVSNTSDTTVPADRISCSGLESAASSSHYLPLGKMCYMCFDDVDTEDNPLLAPCQCLGDTRYVHIDCLQKWHTTSANNKVCVVLNNKGVRICTVCKTPYKPSVRLANGEVVSLFQSPLSPPYICFMVVTKHLNNEDLFSTKYQLSFASVLNRYDSRYLICLFSKYITDRT